MPSATSAASRAISESGSTSGVALPARSISGMTSRSRAPGCRRGPARPTSSPVRADRRGVDVRRTGFGPAVAARARATACGLLSSSPRSPRRPAVRRPLRAALPAPVPEVQYPHSGTVTSSRRVSGSRISAWASSRSPRQPHSRTCRTDTHCSWTHSNPRLTGRQISRNCGHRRAGPEPNECRARGRPGLFEAVDGISLTAAAGRTRWAAAANGCARARRRHRLNPRERRREHSRRSPRPRPALAVIAGSRGGGSVSPSRRRSPCAAICRRFDG